MDWARGGGGGGGIMSMLGDVLAECFEKPRWKLWDL